MNLAHRIMKASTPGFAVAAAGGSEYGFVVGYSFGPDGDFRRCLVCDAKFAQGDEGFAAFKLHEFEEHEAPMTFEWRELHGLAVTLFYVESVDDSWAGNERQEMDLFARGADGTIYALPDINTWGYAKNGGDKWKPKLNGNLLRLMQPDPVSPSSG